ncbi:MAG: hypothetical protein WAU70_11730 [Flavobacteriales bacterium]
MRTPSALLLILASLPLNAQIIDPGFEAGGGWTYTCTPGFSIDVPEYGGTTSASMPMLSSTQPDCYHIDGIIPRAYQELTGVQNGDQVTVACWTKCVPDVPANAPFLNAELTLGWLTTGGVLDFQLAGFAGANVQATWTQIGMTYTFGGMPAGATPVLMLAGSTFNNANGTVYFDNVLISVTGTGAKLSAKAWLDGCYVQAQNLMRDDLRVAGLVPTTSPYGGGQTIAPAVLAVTGSNAIVDWVWMELRMSAPLFSTIQRFALIQRDGDIVDLDGTSPVSFAVRQGNYFIVLHHRNHLGVETAVPLALTSTTTVLDFRSATTSCLVRPAPHTDLPRKTVGTTRALWAGNALNDAQLKYTGANNDRDNILASVGGGVPTNILAGYYLPTDVNMDGVVKYVGVNNDRDPILVNVGGTTPTAVRVEQVP